MKRTIRLSLSLPMLLSLFAPCVSAEDSAITVGGVEDLIRFDFRARNTQQDPS